MESVTVAIDPVSMICPASSIDSTIEKANSGQGTEDPDDTEQIEHEKAEQRAKQQAESEATGNPHQSTMRLYGNRNVAFMNVLVLGATGGVGQHVVRYALSHGHKITALVRNPEKLKSAPTNIKSIQGDVLDRESLLKAVEGQDAVIYAVGTNSTGPTTLFSDSTRILLEAMRHSRARRLVCITGIGAGETKGHGGFLYDRIIYPLFTKNRYRDKERQEEMIRNSSLDWVIVRPAPFHEGGHNEPLQTVTNVEGVTLRRVSREEVAQFVVDQLTDDRFLRQTPFIGHAH